MLRFRMLSLRICGEVSVLMENKGNAGEVFRQENGSRARRPRSAIKCASVDGKSYGTKVLNTVDNYFLQKTRRKGLAHTAMLQQPMLMDLRSRSWMPAATKSTINSVNLTDIPVFQALGHNSMSCNTKTGQCVCGRDHGPRVFLATQRMNTPRRRRERKETSPLQRPLSARQCSPPSLQTPPLRTPRPLRPCSSTRSSPPSRPISARRTVKKYHKPASPPSTPPSPSRPSPYLSYAALRQARPSSPEATPPFRRSHASRAVHSQQALREGSPIQEESTAARLQPSPQPSRMTPHVPRAARSRQGLREDEMDVTGAEATPGQQLAQAFTAGQQSEMGRNPYHSSRPAFSRPGLHTDSSPPLRRSPFQSAKPSYSMQVHKDPLHEQEEKNWKKKQASYDPEDEAMSDVPVARITIIDDPVNVNPSLRTNRMDVDHFVESSLDVNQRGDFFDYFENEGVDTSTEVARLEAKEAANFLHDLHISKQYPNGCPSRGIFCSRTLSLRTITTIGYDMDYTLIHYNVKAWEGRAYEYGLKNLSILGYPTEGLKFDNHLVIRGLILDKAKGNLVKADRFGHIKRAMHGTKMLSSRIISEVYGGELVNLRDDHRWEFLNTLFSMSESVMYMQMVERLDKGEIPPELGKVDYETLYKAVSRALFRAHIEGQLKAEIFNNPDKFVELDAELPIALLDQKDAGKRLLLITNSDYVYTEKMMSYAFNPFLPRGMTWRGLFDLVIVSAKKPEFFQRSSPLYEIVTEDGLMRPCNEPKKGGLYCGGSAFMVEKALGSQGGETLYVGDHIYTDVSQSKVNLRWRTALICRELEREVKAMTRGRGHRAKLIDLMNKKEVVGDVFNQLRLALQRRSRGRPAQTVAATALDEKGLEENMRKLLSLMGRLDQKIAPMLEADGQHFNPKWGYLSRAGLWDKSHLTRQIEKYADVYTSRVANFGRYSPFMYFRSQAQVLGENISSEKIPGIYDMLCKAEESDRQEPKSH